MPTSALGEEATFEELFGLNLFEKGGNKLRLGMYSNADGDKSSWAAEFKFDKSFTLGSPNYPNADKDEFAPAVEGPAFTPEELIAIAQNDYSALSPEQISKLRARLDHSVNDYEKFDVSLSLEGLVALDNEKNLKDFIDFRVEGEYKIWSEDKYTYGGGGFIAYETDQDNDNSNKVYGATVFGQYYFQQGSPNEYLFLKADYGEVDPADNTIRTDLLGGDKSKFNRWEFDATAQFEISIDEVKKIELSYRYFYENNAPDAIESAGLDKFSFFTAGIFLKSGWYLAYSDGELPFSVADEQIYELGWSYQFD